MNIAGMIVLAVFLLFIINGYRKGLVGMLSGVAALLISTFLVNTLLPFVTDYVREQTPAYEWIAGQCERVISTQALETALEDVTKTSSGSYDRDRIKELLSQAGMDSSMVDSVSDSELDTLVETYLKDYMPSVTESTQSALSGLTKIEQVTLMQSLPIPDFLSRIMISHNNSDGYKKLGVTDFAGYITHFIANVILNILTFIVTMVVVWSLVRIILGAMNLAAHLPLIGSVNRLGGALLGAVKALFVVWIGFLLVSVLSGTQAGMSVQNLINDSLVLQPMYESNLFLRVVSNALQSFL